MYVNKHLRTLQHQADIINRGFGGYNSRWGVWLLEEALSTFDPKRIKVAVVEFGANDAAAPDKWS